MNEIDEQGGMSKIVKVISKITYIFILTFGLYIILHGHLTPGGGFQGGAIIASAFALLLVAYGKRNILLFLNKNKLPLLESIAALTFLLLALLGLGSTFFYNELANSGGLFGNSLDYGSNSGNINTSGLIPLMNLSVGLKVLAGIGSLVIIMALSLGSRLGGDSYA